MICTDPSELPDDAPDGLDIQVKYKASDGSWYNNWIPKKRCRKDSGEDGKEQCAKGSDKETLEEAARAAVAELLEGKDVVKVIVVPERLVNFVVK